MHLPIEVAESEKGTVKTEALLDCGAGGTFIDQQFVKTHKMTTSSTRKCWALALGSAMDSTAGAATMATCAPPHSSNALIAISTLCQEICTRHQCLTLTSAHVPQEACP
jgi:hypothetical protein